MKTSLLIGILCLSLFSGCSKGDGSDPSLPPTPPPTLPPPTAAFTDTLTTGWSKQFLGTPDVIEDIFFNSALTGYAIGPGIFKTIDGGTTWNRVHTQPAFYNMFTTADNKSFFLYWNNIVKTMDGGQTYSQMSLNSGFPNDIFFIDNNTGYSPTREGLYTTTNGGVSWTKIQTSGLNIDPTYYSTLFCRSSTSGWIASRKSIFRAAGSYSSWTAAGIPGEILGHFTSINAPSANTIYAATDSNEIFKSTDAGMTFSRIIKFRGEDFNDLHFINDNVGYNSHGRRIYKTVDGGLNWTVVVVVRHPISEIHFVDATHGWASGDSGMVLTYKP